jgi:hypothetical protein
LRQVSAAEVLEVVLQVEGCRGCAEGYVMPGAVRVRCGKPQAEEFVECVAGLGQRAGASQKSAVELLGFPTEKVLIKSGAPIVHFYPIGRLPLWEV